MIFPHVAQNVCVWIGHLMQLFIYFFIYLFDTHTYLLDDTRHDCSSFMVNPRTHGVYISYCVNKLCKIKSNTCVVTNPSMFFFLFVLRVDDSSGKSNICIYVKYPILNCVCASGHWFLPQCNSIASYTDVTSGIAAHSDSKQTHLARGCINFNTCNSILALP